MNHSLFMAFVIVCSVVSPPARSDEQSPPVPDAVLDLRTTDGVAAVRGVWKAMPASIVEVDHRFPGPDRRPTGAPNRTHDIAPKAGVADFDDANWPVVTPESLEERLGAGRLSFVWYRLDLTIPDHIGRVDCEGARVYFELVADDYAEVWVDGGLAPTLGQAGGSMIAGWNAPNRVLITDNAVPGSTHRIAALVANGPVSDAPPNYIWIRSATLDIYGRARDPVATVVPHQVIRMDPAIDAIIPSDAVMQRVATGFGFAEGPVWVADDRIIGGGALLFSDPNRNVIHRWSPDGTVSIFRTKSGYAGADIGEYPQPGSNGLALDAEGRLTICEHGNRRVTRLEKNGAITVLADKFAGDRLNSPNDLVYRSDGALFFTDPAFGLPGFADDPRKETPHQGVYCLIGGELKLVSTDLNGPNGLALSPDEQTLYVANWDETRKVVMRYDVRADGSLANGSAFHDMTAAPGEEALDGLKVDGSGNVYVSGPVGVWILAPDGRHLGTLIAPELPANFAWGDRDGRTLYLAARSSIYRIHLKAAAPQVAVPES
jgi:gluconolactonase